MKTEKPESKSKRASRREFTKRVAATLVAAPLAAATIARAQTPAKTKQAPAPPNPAPLDTDKPSPVAVAYAEVARERFGKQVEPEQFEQIRKDLEGNARVAERLRLFKLKNSDEPDFVFSA